MTRENSKDNADYNVTKKFETPNASSTSSSYISGSGWINLFSVSPHFALDRKEDNSQNAEGMKLSLPLMGIFRPRPLDLNTIKTLKVG